MAELQCPAEMAECPHAKRSAEYAVKRVFAILGVDIDVPKDVEEFRENLRFGANMRRTHLNRAKQTQNTLISVLVGILCAVIYAGVLQKLGGG